MPYYILRYEKEFSVIEKNQVRLDCLVQEFQDITARMRQELTNIEYISLCELTGRVVSFVARDEKRIREELEKVMSGRVLKLEWEKYLEQGEKLGKKGEKRGEKRGEEKIIQMYRILRDQNWYDDINRCLDDVKYRKRILKELNI